MRPLPSLLRLTISLIALLAIIITIGVINIFLTGILLKKTIFGAILKNDQFLTNSSQGYNDPLPGNDYI
jgi:hypothetical protein